jgi:hypothetical protein
MTNFTKNSTKPIDNADSILPVIKNAINVVVQVAVTRQVVAFKILRFLLSIEKFLVETCGIPLAILPYWIRILKSD